MLGKLLLKWRVKSASKKRNRLFSGGCKVINDIRYDGKNTADIWTQEGEADRVLIVYIHGGGFVAGDKSNFNAFCEFWCLKGYNILNINYSLAPKMNHPTPIQDIINAISFFTERQEQFAVRFDRLILSGDSAGAFIAYSAALAIENEEYARGIHVEIGFSPKSLKGLILYCGAFNLDTAKDCAFPFIGEFISDYTGVKKVNQLQNIPEYERINPWKNMIASLPPVFLTAGRGDPFFNESVALKAELMALGVDVTFYGVENVKARHEYFGFLETELAKSCVVEVEKFLKRIV